MIKKRVKPARALPKETTNEEISKAVESLDEMPLEVDGIDIVEVSSEEPAQPTLTKDELYRLQITQMQARAAEAEAALEILRRDLLQKQIDPENRLGRMASFIRGRTNEAAEAKLAYEAIVKQIEARLNISLKEWAYNDENGQLSKVDS